jgi:hypothetical protein
MNEEIPDDVKRRIEKIVQEFMASWKNEKPCTVILTTDGQKYSITDSSHPLPEKYLEEWHEDSKRFDVDLIL